MHRYLPVLAGLLLLLGWPPTAAAQPGWPHNPTSGEVEFKGVLPWPARAVTSAQRQALVRRWFITRLTNADPKKFAQLKPSQVTYARLPTWAYLDSTTHPHTDEVYLLRLLYEVRFTTTAQGLAYRLSTFQCSSAGFDVSSTLPLEQTLDYWPQCAATLAVWRQKLRLALTGW